MQPKTEKPLYFDCMARIPLIERHLCREIAVAADALLIFSFTSVRHEPREENHLHRRARQIWKAGQTSFITPAGTLDLHLSPVDEMI